MPSITRGKSSPSLADVVRSFLEKKKWHCREEKATRGRVVFHGGIGGFKPPCTSFLFFLVVGREEVQCYAMFPTSASKKCLPGICEFIARANHGLIHGAFELDCDSGEIRYHLTMPGSAVRTDTENALLMLLMLPPQMLDRYARGLYDVLLKDVSPEIACLKCENQNGGKSAGRDAERSANE